MTTHSRRRSPAKITACFVALATALSVGACTNNGESTSSSADSSGSSSFDLSSVKTDDSLASQVPAAIKSKGTIDVGHDATYAPAEFMSSDGHTIEGSDVQITDAIAKILGLKANHMNGSFDSLIPAVGTKYDMAASSFTVTPEREKQVNMVTYFKAGTSYAVPKGNPGNIKVGDLCGKTVAVQNATTQQDQVEEMNQKCTDKINIQTYPAQTDVATAVSGGKAQVMLSDTPVASYAAKKSNGKIELLGDPQDSADEAIVVAKDQSEFATLVQKAVQKLIDDGTMKTILSGWGTENGMISKSEVNPSS